MSRPFIILESPYAGDLDRNILYLKRALRYSWDQGEFPLASHAYMPLFLAESKPAERKLGIESWYKLWPLAKHVIFYIDYGMSPGMEKALDRATHHRLDVVTRSIGINP